MSGFFEEVRRRKVYRVAIACVVAGWALAQGLSQVLPVFDIPTRDRLFFDLPTTFETRSLPTLPRSYPRHFAFYVALPTRSIQLFQLF